MYPHIPTPAELQAKQRRDAGYNLELLVNHILREVADADFKLPLRIKPGYITIRDKGALWDEWCDLSRGDQDLMDMACKEAKELLYTKGWFVNVYGNASSWWSRGWVRIDWQQG